MLGFSGAYAMGCHLGKLCKCMHLQERMCHHGIITNSVDESKETFEGVLLRNVLCVLQSTMKLDPGTTRRKPCCLAKSTGGR